MKTIINNGILPRYKDAELDNLAKEAGIELHKLKKFFLSLSKEDFYNKKPNIYIFGAHRRGKTWMLHALFNYIKKTYGEKSIYFITAPQLIKYSMKLRDNINDILESEFAIFKLSNVLFIDDFGLEYKTDSGYAENIMEEFLRWRFSYNKITLIASNLTVDDLEKIYGKSMADFIYGEYITYEIYEDCKDLSKLFLEMKWKKNANN